MRSESGAATASPGARRASFQRFYDETSTPAFSLALRIAGDREAATQACQRGYLDLWDSAEAEPAWQQELLFERVRAHSFAFRPGSAGFQSTVTGDAAYTMATTVRSAIAELDAFPRRCLDLAYFGGVSVSEIADILRQPVDAVRAALRSGLLQIGSRLRAEEESSP